MNPHKVTEQFEEAIARYTGAPYAVATTSCTMAIFLALQWHKHKFGPTAAIECPRYTYCSVPMQIIHAGSKIRWVDLDWESRGWYTLYPTNVIDSARLLTAGMHVPRTLQCVSFHWTKHLGLGQGGAILTDSREAVDWLRRARFDGRTPGTPPAQDAFMLGWHAYMSPRDAAEGLSRLAALPQHNDPLPWDGYPDLSQQAVFLPHAAKT